ncbi:hypothetical protein IAU59_006352 [Kwoniella sp. CBS 9459]
MYPESGPSRIPMYPNKPIPVNNGPGPSPRPGSSRWEGDFEPPRDKDERFNGYARSSESSSSRPYAVPPWQNRTPRQGFRGPSGSGGPGPRPRSHTPSPPRRGYERDRDRDRDRDRTFDVRDRLSLDSGWRAAGGGPAPNTGGSGGIGPDIPPPRRGPGFGSQPVREREGSWARDDRRWNERRDDRFRDEPRSLPSSRPGSAPQNQSNRFPSERVPPPRSPPAASRNIRPVGAAQTTPAYASSRIPSSSSAPASRLNQYSTPGRDERERGPFTPRDAGRPFDRAVSSAGPPSLAYAASQRSRPPSPSSTPAPRAPRSMRGSSSPVDTRRARDGEDPQNVPISNGSQPDEMDQPADEDLEEGEVVSPVQATRAPTWSYTHEDRTRRAYSPPRDRDRWDREHDRERDRRRTPPSPHWAGRRPLNDSWNGRGRRRSNSNPTRWRGDDDVEVNSAARSPKKPVFAREEGEVAPTEKEDPTISHGIIEETDPFVQEEEEEKIDRPPTPPIPPPPPVSDFPLVSTIEAAEEQKSDNGLHLEVPSQPSRPDTPVLPPPADTNPSIHNDHEAGEEQGERSLEDVTGLKVEVEVPDRPETPSVPPSSIGHVEAISQEIPENVKVEVETEVTPVAPTEMVPVTNTDTAVPQVNDIERTAIDQDIANLGSETKLEGQVDLAHDQLGVRAEPERMADPSGVIPMEVDETLDAPTAEPEDTKDVTIEESTKTIRSPPARTEDLGQEAQHDVTSTDNIQAASAADVTSDGPVAELPDVKSVLAADADEDAAMQDATETEKTRPSPTAPISSSSESAVTPAAPTDRQASVEVEIALETSDAAPSPTSSAPVSLGKPNSSSQARSPLVPVSQDESSDTPPSPPTRRVTLAERRAIQLPPTNGPLSSPFGDRFPRKDPNPTAYSTDAETEGGPKTGDIQERDLTMLEVATEETRQTNLMAAIKAAQMKIVAPAIAPVMAWNVAAAPTDTSRVVAVDDPEREGMLKHFVWPLAQQQDLVAKLVAGTIARENAALSEKSERLKAEYMQLDEEWKDHCDYLDSLMEKRGPPPADLYAVPGAIPVATPGPVAPTTPLTEDMFNARGNRRRGAGDAVTTEAEFEAILAGLADTAAKDPTYRANKTSAVVPDMLLGEERKLRYDDDNDLITDPLAFYDFEGNAEPIWAPEERALFVRRYMAYPKQFGRVADGISAKTASDCVLYYYRTKKEVDYKGMLASKRGGGKKKTMPIKKGGKSAALLADLEKKKPTVSNDGTSTPVRGGKDREREDSVVPGTSARKTKNAGTPAEDGRRRRRTTAASNASIAAGNTNANDDEDKMESSATSRATSEAPSATASKAKMRVTMKTAKRPRVSSISENARQAVSSSTPSTVNTAPPIATATAPVPGTAIATTAATIAADPPTEPVNPATNQSLDPDTAQTELLPPVKRAGKRRKVAVDPSAVDQNADPAAAQANGANVPTLSTAQGAATTAEKPTRRSATNSYWSVEEKRKVKELVAVLGTDIKAIAAQLKGKSERQVGNFLEGHRAELLEGAAAAGSGGAATGVVQVKPEDDQRGTTSVHSTPSITPSETFRSVQPTRTIYDAFPSFGNSQQDRYEPRLGMFPPSPPHAASNAKGSGPGSTLAPDSSPVKPVSRSGGMRISALLNDDGPASKPAINASTSVNVKERERERPSTGVSVADTIDAASDGTVDDRDLDVSAVTRPSPRSMPPAPISHLADPSGYSRYDQHYPHSQPHHHQQHQHQHQHQQQQFDHDRYRSSASVPAQTPYASTPTAWSGSRSTESTRNDGYHQQREYERERERERASTTTPVPPHHTINSAPVSHRGSWTSEMHSPHLNQPHVMPVGSGHRSNSHSTASTTSASSRYDPYRAPPPSISVDHAHAHQSRHYDYASERPYSREMDPRYAQNPTHHAAHPHAHPHQHSHAQSHRSHSHHLPNGNGGGMNLPSLKSSGLGLMPVSLGSGTTSGASASASGGPGGSASVSVSPSAPPPQLSSVRSYDERDRT